MMKDESANIGEINSALQESFIHYQPERTDYTINSHELKALEERGNSIWKDVFFGSAGLGAPCIINGLCLISALEENKNWGADIFLNLLVGGITLSVGTISFILWMRDKKNSIDIINDIKNKPKYKLPTATPYSNPAF